MIKDERLFIKISKIEKQELHEFAKKTPHKNLSNFFRFICNEYRALGKNGTDLLNEIIKIRHELSAIGNNLNQIAKKINQNNNLNFATIAAGRRRTGTFHPCPGGGPQVYY